MKNLKFLLLVLAMLATVLAFASCGTKTLTFDETYSFEDDADAPKLFNKVTSWELEKGWTLADTISNYLILSKTENNKTTYRFYSIEKDEKILESENMFTNYKTVNALSSYPLTLVSVTDKDDNIITYLLNKSGKTIATADKLITYDSYSSEGESLYVYGDFIVFDGNIYHYDDEKLTLFCEEPAFSDISFLDNVTVTGSYIIHKSGDTVKYYDKNLNPVTTHTIPSYASENVYILENGNLLVQYTVSVDMLSKKYDILSNSSSKSDLVQYIFNVETNKTKEIDLDGYVIGAYSADEAEGINGENVNNIVAIAPIVDYRVDKNVYEIYAMDNKGKVGAALYSPFDVAGYVENLGNGYYLASSINGDNAIINSNGEIIKNISGSSVSCRDYGFVASNYNYNVSKVYDAKFKVIFDAKDKEIITDNNYSIVYHTEDDDGERSYYIFTKNGTKQISDDGEWKVDYVSTLGNGIFYVTYENEDGKSSYAYYAADGSLLIERDEHYKSTFVSSGSTVILKYYDSTKAEYVYYKVTAK